ncbi:hypothetical protein CBL_06670 [Carabus blaptoides fortunei]
MSVNNSAIRAQTSDYCKSALSSWLDLKPGFATANSTTDSQRANGRGLPGGLLRAPQPHAPPRGAQGWPKDTAASFSHAASVDKCWRSYGVHDGTLQVSKHMFLFVSDCLEQIRVNLLGVTQ